MKYDIKVSKYLSYVLRHAPKTIGITMDENGWVNINELIQKAKEPMTRAELEAAVAGNEKKRFTIEGDKIRANQGHSIKVDVELEEIVPPEYLYHGTAEHLLATIYREGIQKMGRQHVHLSADRETAKQVGSRHGIPHVVVVEALVMHAAGHKFYRSVNGVYLVDEVPPVFIP